jgi:hypothetical protein
MQQSRVWVNGNTRIEVAEGAASWQADWRVSFSEGAPRRLAIEPEAGLEILEVTGPSVRGYGKDASSDRRRLVIQFDEASGPVVAFALRGSARIPDEGPWDVPGVALLDSVWTGGRTQIRIAATRLLEECIERVGMRVTLGSDELEGASASTGLVLAFATSSPSSVALLTFRRPDVAISAGVRGELLLRPDDVRLETEIDWRVQGGQVADIAADLPPGWRPDRVEMAGTDEPVAWQTEPLGGGGLRLLVHLPPALEGAKAVRLLLSAHGPPSGKDVLLDLPRITPVGARVTDEVWLARSEGGPVLSLVSAVGLDWLEPAIVGAGDAIVAWRWTRPDGAARIRVDRRRSLLANAVREQVVLHEGRLSLEALLNLELGEDGTNRVAVGLSEPTDAVPVVRMTGENDGPPLVLQVLDGQALSKSGLEGQARAWVITLPQSRRGQVALSLTLETAWQGEGAIPLVRTPGPLGCEGTALVFVDRAVQTTLESIGTRKLATDEPHGPRAALSGLRATTMRLAHALAYGSSSGRVKIRTKSLRTIATDGHIADATLVTTWSPQAPARHELTLRLAATVPTHLEISLPQGSVLERAELEGRPILPQRDKMGSLAILVPGSSRTHPFVNLCLDYTAGSGTSAGPASPRLSWPCLSFNWCFRVSDPFVVVPGDPRFVLQHAGSKAVGFDLGIRDWSLLTLGSRSAQGSAAVVPGWQGEVLRQSDVVSTLGDLVMRGDAAGLPVIVDRPALERAGLNPRTAIPTRGPEGTIAETLGGLGLSVLPASGVAVLTTRDEAESHPSHELVRGALEAGTDVTDRYETAARWWLEAGPSGPGSRSMGDREPGSFLPLRNRQDFAAPRWPAEGPVRWFDRLTGLRWTWVSSAMVLALAMSVSAWPWRTRAYVAACIVAVLAALAPWWVAGQFEWVVGMGLGVLAGAAFWLGRTLHRDPRSSPGGPVDPRGGTNSRLTAAAAGSAGLVCLAWVAAPWPLARAADESPIIAIYPEETGDKLGTVVLLLRDYERLRAWARPQPAERSAPVGASQAEHIVRFTAPGEAAVESRLTLWLDSDASGSWRFPLGAARDVSATRDGREAGLQIEPGARAATLTLEGRGRHEVVLRRSVVLEGEGRNRTLRLPINSVAQTLLSYAEPAKGLRVETPSSRGVAGRLGPVDGLEVHFVDPKPDGNPTARGSAEGLLLWDAEPAGDRLRARIVYHNAAGLHRIRLGLEEGMMVLSTSIPGLVETSWQGPRERPEWVAHVDPPLPDGVKIEVDLWRPSGARAPRATGRLDPGVRGLPRLEPLDAGAYLGTVAFRHPVGWSGRLRPVAGSDPVPDETFVKAWGELPDSSATLAGAIRFAVSPRIDVATGPAPVRTAARPAVDVEIQPGRLVVRSQVVLTDIEGHLREAIVPLPGAFRLVRVEASGLTSWSRPSREQLRLRFDGPDLGPRTLTIEGWVAVASDPLATQPAQHAVPVPWLVPEGLEDEPGTLAVGATGAVAVRLEPRPGATSPLGAAPTSVEGQSLVRSVYRVESSAGLGTLRWTDEPGRSEVTIRSILTVDPDSAEWLATLRIRATRGPVQTVLLKAPRSWSSHARFELGDNRAQITVEPKGEETLWMIRFKEPVWNTPTLLIRATSPLREGRPLEMPDLVPLGRGVVDTYLALVNASGGSIATEDSSGLQSVAVERFPTNDLPSLRGPIDRVFRVLKEGWRLEVRPLPSLAADGASPLSTHVSLADLECTIAADDTIRGEASYEVEPRHGAFFPVVLPSGTRILAAAVDGLPVRPLELASGRIAVPLTGTAAARVELAWEATSRVDRPPQIRFPALLESDIPTLLTVHLPDTAALESLPPGLEAAGPADLAAQRAEWTARRALQTVETMDRQSPSDRAVLSGQLLRFDVLERCASRFAQRTASGRVGAAPDALVRVATRLQASRKRVAEAVRAAGLEPLLRVARSGIRSSSTAPLADSPGPLTPARAFRIPRLGRPHGFQTRSSNDLASLRLVLRRVPEVPIWARPATWALWIGGGLAAVLLVRVTRQWGRPSRTWQWAAVGGLTLIAALAGPLATGLTLAMLAFGLAARA